MADKTSVALRVKQAIHMGVGVVMSDLENRIFCRLDGLTPAAREQKRLAAIQELNLLTTETVAVFDEATQMAARLLEAPICILSIMRHDRQQIKSAVGLSRVGLMNELAQSRQLPRTESFCTYVVDSHQVVVIHDTATNPVFANSLLVGYYGIRAYLGAPLLTADGLCLGTLAVMDCVPRSFTAKDAEFMAITARWCLSEYERNHLLRGEHKSSIPLLPKLSAVDRESDSTTDSQENLNDVSACHSSTNALKVKLLTQLTQDLRTPLTSIMGMASVLGRQIYGPLTSKQKEYLEIIHQSGKHLVLLVEEIIALGLLDNSSDDLELRSVDIEMLCQQAINNLFEIAQARQQELRLSVAPGSRIWLLNKNKVRQMLYYLIFSVMQAAEAGCEVRIHVSDKDEHLNIAVWTFHPWLEQGLPQVSEEIAPQLPLSASATAVFEVLETLPTSDRLDSSQVASNSYLPPLEEVSHDASVWAADTFVQELSKTLGNDDSRETLGLLLSCHLAELHGGQIYVQGSLESGDRYVISLPKLELTQERL